MAEEKLDIIVIDDDPMVGTLTRDLLADEGYKVMLIQDSMEAMSAIKEQRPILVIVDIMMPGLDGMELLKRIKSDSDMKDIKVVVVSGKSFQSEKQKAIRLGADFYIQKPYNVAFYSKTIKQVIEGTPIPVPPPLPSPPKIPVSEKEQSIHELCLKPGELHITVRGCRGLSLSAPDTGSAYGRQTCCVSVETKDNILIFDAGTGIIKLGEELIRRAKPKDIWLFLTHFHNDHIMGLAEFAPMQNSDYTVNILGPNDPEKSLRDAVHQIFYGSFALAKQPPRAKINLYDSLEDTYEPLPGIKLNAMYSNHPTTTFCFRLELCGKTLIYAPDSELFDEATALQDYNEKLGYFCKNADLLIHDSNYNDADWEMHRSEGHSCASNALQFAAENAKVKELMLFHLNAGYSDKKLDALHEECVKTVKE